ncbi:MAG: hypothetical protein AAF335_02835 [Bacteroidota bacterium]
MTKTSKACFSFLKGQALRLFFVSSCDTSEKERQKSYCVGFSCLLIWLLPWAYLYWAMKEVTVWDYLVYGLLGISSFSGDYLFVDTKVYPVISQHVVFVDNWVVFSSVLFNVGKFVYYGRFPDARTILCLVLVVLALSCLHLSRHASSQKRWVCFHTLWHLFAIGIALSVLEVQRVA